MAAQRRAKKGGAGGKIFALVLVIIIIGAIVYGLVSGGGETRGGIVTIDVPKSYITVPSGKLITKEVPFDREPELPVTDPETGDPAWPAYVCYNDDCPGADGDERYRFPYNQNEMDSLYCPECRAAGFSEREYTNVKRHTLREAAEILRKTQEEAGM